ncbi:anthranilate synthase component II [Xanthomonas translucens]|uniref:anthranilate synthase component II n=1 Tax=Xanthomonas campestris pv. translucens TaxID=343 RepID=UPI00071AFEB8|nr:aminodeoxychorismate/anthranilate synthase component II [Xanthomonas translucens]
MSTRVTIVDAYDSFVHILVDYVRQLDCEVRVVRRNASDLFATVDPEVCDVILLGPGPGHPSDSGYLQLLEQNREQLPVFGVCLGHQAIGLYYGAKLAYAEHLVHGKTSLVRHDGLGCFAGLPAQGIRAMRYHSIIVDRKSLPPCLTATATASGDGYLMGLRHNRFAVEGVQFHPESIGTEYGMEIIRNFIKSYHKEWGDRRHQSGGSPAARA